MSRQAVQYHVKRAGLPVPLRAAVRCSACRAPITTGEHRMENNRGALCLACLAGRPDTPFGLRVRACRLAAGLTLRELGERLGMPVQSLHAVEWGKVWPKWETVRKLVAVLGAELLTLGLAVPEKKGRRAKGRAGPAG